MLFVLVTQNECYLRYCCDKSEQSRKKMYQESIILSGKFEKVLENRI